MIEGVHIDLQVYMLAYILLILSTVYLVIKRRREFGCFGHCYWRFIFTPWKFFVYVIGTIALVAPVECLNYHSWDYPIALFQPVVTYLQAPWATDVFYRFMLRKTQRYEIFVAGCMMMFAGCWSVELYLLWRDGYYMPDWFINIPIGISCFIFTGILWNISWVNGRPEMVWFHKSR